MSIIVKRETERPIVVLGAGITGLTVAWRLAQRYGDRVILLEKEPTTGGLAATLRSGDHAVDLGMHQLDLGSHRIHEQYEPRVLELIRELLGPDLLRRPRRGLILIRDRLLSYPPSILQILSAYGWGASISFIRDYAAAALLRATRGPDEHDFRSYAIRAVGRSLYEAFYKPYAEKLWGMPPEEVSHEPAKNRVRKFRAGALFGELAARARNRDAHHFYYPARGIGQIAEAVEERFLASGGRLVTGASIEAMETQADFRVSAVRFHAQGRTEVIADPCWVVATAPLDVLHRLVRLDSDGPAPPPFDLRWRSLRILYLVTGDRIPAPNETYYIPEPPYLIGRVSELAKYSPALAPSTGECLLTVELPCTEGDTVWSMEPAELQAVCVEELQRLGVLTRPLRHPVASAQRRIRNLYPIHRIGWRDSFRKIHGRLDRLENLYLIGRPALFLHCNIDHCMRMALELADFLLEDGQDRQRWRRTSEAYFDFQVKD